jgi:hypothetical protein
LPHASRIRQVDAESYKKPNKALLREVLADPADEEHGEMLEWLCLQTAAEFDPARFDVDEVNRALGSGDDARRAVRRAA